ncbi:hypothetical protein [Azotobacter beijerinckii]|uniref:Peptidase family M41 n=1 Tax=Azotobacter beijerinckii TaxID=170623 RepID=A0A1I4FTR0_9GAMM|nr:hypothetical protein [Azotobacter beijerinckii]SFB62754.1 hypothetical protein SAMN04244571_04443 [Azotobacter beijerinckii]SFL21302.1 hypothetical protein SAMN04244574_03550 [Azotobacter beijerinckii]
MNLSQLQQMPLRVRVLSQHEAAHYVTALALGFDAQEITLQVQSLDAHRGKARTDCIARCESLLELQEFMRCRILIILAGAMGEAINRTTYEVDGKAAYKILDEGSTGAGQDFAVAKELILLLHNSLPVSVNPQTGKGQTSKDLLVEFLGEALAWVTINARPICDLADVLTERVVAGRGSGGLQKAEIEQLPFYYHIQRSFDV